MVMFDTISQFHFIRPLWLLSLLPLAFAIGGLMMKNRRQNQWLNVIDKNLLKHLLVGQKTVKQSTISPMLFLSLSLVLAVTAMAGPAWQKQPLPVFETEISKVIVLDLSLSMKSTDIKPNRLTRAKHKITDILSRTKEGQVALIVYAGDAFVISPLTTDANTIATMIPPLSPSLMPVLGSEPQNAFKLADELLINAGVFSGQIIWITDGVDDRDYGFVSEQLSASRHQISILAVGTSDGAPIPLPDGQGFLKDAGGNIILPGMNMAPLAQLAEMGSGSITKLAADDSDVDLLLSSFKDPQDFISSDEDLEMDRWVEFGPWLLLPVIIVVAFSFRKGVVVALFLTLFPVLPKTDAAEPEPEPPLPQEESVLEQQWTDLWQTADQQAATAFKNEDHKTAADLFQQKDWKSAALYKSGQYNAASDLLSTMDTATAHYNRGNALAYGGQLEAAISSYEKALEQSPSMEDAAFNKSIVEEMLKQQQEQEQQEQQDQQKDGEQQESDQQSDQDGEQQESEEQQQDGQQQDSEQQQQEDQENKEQQGEEQQSELEKMSDAEKEQVLEQWLRQIKDDPGGLLRRKMYMEYQRRQQQGKKDQNKGEQVW